MKMLKDLFIYYKFKVSFIILALSATLALLSVFSPYDPLRLLQVPCDRSPCWPYILGTTSRGQDVFWQATFAIRNSLILGIIAAGLSRVIAIIISFVAGYKGGFIDRALMMVTDGFLVIPILLILVMVSALLKEALTYVKVGFLLAFFGWAWDTRTIRSQILSLREREFTQTSILSGNSTLSLVLKEYLPFVLPLILSTFISAMAWAIGMEATLAFLGLTRLEVPTLGTMIKWALTYQAILQGHWWWIWTPVVLIILLIIGLYWFSVSISEYLDPRVRIQRIGL